MKNYECANNLFLCIDKQQIMRFKLPKICKNPEIKIAFQSRRYIKLQITLLEKNISRQAHVAKQKSITLALKIRLEFEMRSARAVEAGGNATQYSEGEKQTTSKWGNKWKWGGFSGCWENAPDHTFHLLSTWLGESVTDVIKRNYF